MQSRIIHYSLGEDTFESTFVVANNTGEPKPAILIVPNLWGPNEYWTAHAHRIAELGYHAMVVDMYTESVRPKTHDEAYAVISSYRTNRALVRKRIQKALEVVREQPEVDAAKVAAIGYCFGGMCVLELARSGSGVIGVVSLHGLLTAQESETTHVPQAKILVLHGAEDPMVPDEQVAGFMQEMRAVNADWQTVHFGGAVHAFTDKNADRPGEAIYDEKADKRSFLMMRNFLEELFQ